MSNEVVDKCFVGTASRIGGITFDLLAQDVLALHSAAYGDHRFPDDSPESRAVPHPGDYHFRAAPGSERHMNDPAGIALLQEAATVRELFV
jgi:glutamate synthase (NADPH/NADH)